MPSTLFWTHFLKPFIILKTSMWSSRILFYFLVVWKEKVAYTRKLSYRKDDRAMRTIWCPENFRESLSTPTATFPEFLLGFCCDRSSECATKFVEVRIALPLAEIIGVLKQFGQSLDTPTLSFLQNFEWASFRSDGPTLWMCRPNLKSVALPVPEIIAIEVLGVANPNLGEEKAAGGRRWYHSKERWWFPIGPE